MKLLRLFISGEFEDAYVYMGWLTALTTDRSLRLYNLEEAAELIDISLPRSTPVARYFFARNDWFNSGPFTSIASNPVLSKAFWDGVDFFPSTVEANAYFAPAGEHSLRLTSDVILDVGFYGGRMYLGANDGFYDLQMDWDEPQVVGAPRRRLDARCLSLSARFGAVNASCGAEGLFTGLGEINGQDNLRVSRELITIANESIRTGWLDYDIVNYPTNSSAALFKTTHKREASQRVTEPRLITAVNPSPFNLEYLLKQVEDRFGPGENSVQYVFNSNRVMFAHTYQGDFFAVGITPEEAGEPRVKFTRTYKGESTRILSAHVCKVGVVVETDDNVLLLANGEWFHLVDSPVLSVRTFARSKRFQNLVAITTERGIWLVSIVDETRSQRPGGWS